MLLLNIAGTSLPLTNPVVKFLVILIIILSVPILLNKLKVPAILGLIVAGAVIGPNGFNLLLRDSSIILRERLDCCILGSWGDWRLTSSDFRKNSGGDWWSVPTPFSPYDSGTLAACSAWVLSAHLGFACQYVRLAHTDRLPYSE